MITLFYKTGKIMSLIPAYEACVVVPRPNAYFNPKTKVISAVEDFEDISISEVLDAMTLAAEAGLVERAGWVMQFFGDAMGFRAFIAELEQYEYRINDRWHQALMAIAGLKEESGFVTNEEIAAVLMDSAAESGQL